VGEEIIERKAPALPVWVVEGAFLAEPARTLKVRAATKAEARGVAKRHLGLDRLPPGAVVRKAEQVATAAPDGPLVA
jgi:hypothetical protein